MSVSEAILKINPDLEFYLQNDDYDSIQWLNIDPYINADMIPNKDEVMALAEEIKQKKQLELARVKQYPKIADQLDMLWHSMNSGEIPKAEKWFNLIKDVKDSNPKSK